MLFIWLKFNLELINMVRRLKLTLMKELSACLDAEKIQEIILARIRKLNHRTLLVLAQNLRLFFSCTTFSGNNGNLEDK